MNETRSPTAIVSSSGIAWPSWIMMVCGNVCGAAGLPGDVGVDVPELHELASRAESARPATRRLMLATCVTTKITEFTKLIPQDTLECVAFVSFVAFVVPLRTMYPNRA